MNDKNIKQKPINILIQTANDWSSTVYQLVKTPDIIIHSPKEQRTFFEKTFISVYFKKSMYLKLFQKKNS